MNINRFTARQKLYARFRESESSRVTDNRSVDACVLLISAGKSCPSSGYEVTSVEAPSNLVSTLRAYQRHLREVERKDKFSSTM